MTAEQFESLVEAGGFLEWVDFLDYRQGTPLPDPPDGADVLFEIDVYGARTVRQHDPDALLIFVDAPSRDEQERRLRRRGDDDAKVRQRLAKADEERALAAELAMVRVVNDDLDRAVAEIRSLVAETRAGAAS